MMMSLLANTTWMQFFPILFPMLIGFLVLAGIQIGTFHLRMRRDDRETKKVVDTALGSLKTRLEKDIKDNRMVCDMRHSESQARWEKIAAMNEKQHHHSQQLSRIESKLDQHLQK